MDKEILLYKLLCLFSVDSDGELHWRYIEGISVGDKLGEDVEQNLIRVKKSIKMQSNFIEAMADDIIANSESEELAKGAKIIKKAIKEGGDIYIT